MQTKNYFSTNVLRALKNDSKEFIGKCTEDLPSDFLKHHNWETNLYGAINCIEQAPDNFLTEKEKDWEIPQLDLITNETWKSIIKIFNKKMKINLKFNFDGSLPSFCNHLYDFMTKIIEVRTEEANAGEYGTVENDEGMAPWSTRQTIH